MDVNIHQEFQKYGWFWLGQTKLWEPDCWDGTWNTYKLGLSELASKSKYISKALQQTDFRDSIL